MAQQEQNENNIDESELLTLINEEKKLLTNQLHTRLKVRYAAGIGISTAIVMRMASLQLDLALSISTFAFIIAIPLFAYLIFSLDEAEHPYIEYVWPRATVFEEEIESMERVLSMLEERTGDMQDVVDEISERYKSRLEKSNARAHKRVVDGLVVGLIAYFAVIIGFAAFLWHIAWYYSVLFVVLSFLMSYRFFRTFKWRE